MQNTSGQGTIKEKSSLEININDDWIKKYYVVWDNNLNPYM